MNEIVKKLSEILANQGKSFLKEVITEILETNPAKEERGKELDICEEKSIDKQD